jgi:ribosomal protein L7/L12
MLCDYASEVTGAEERAQRDRLLAEMAQALQAAGADADQMARALLQRTDSPISVIRAVHGATGMDLGEAKWVVHRNLSQRARQAAEDLWQSLLDGLESHTTADPDA